MWLSLLCIFVAGVTNVNAATEYEIDQRFTSVASLDGQLFAIVNETDEMALYNKDAQNLAYDTYTNAVAGAAYLWKLHSLAGEADSVVQSCYSVEAVKADGSSINLWGNPAIFINSGAEGGFDGCFILGQGDKYGTDVKYGGVWEIEYLEGQGFALKNVARGGYLAGVNPAPTGEEPIYWTFCTLKEIENTDPLAAEKEALAAAIAKGQMYNGLAYTEESFGTLEFAIDAAEYLLANPESADAESLRDAANNIYNVATALQLKEGFSNLTPEYFMTWDSPIKPATWYSFDGCAYELFTPTGVPFGDPNVGYLNFANLQGYDKLYVTYSDGTPRIMMNRDVDQGQWSDVEDDSHLIEFPKASEGWAAKYFTNEDGVVTVDLKQIVADKGFANLNTIKGANWANVTITGIFLYKVPIYASFADGTYYIYNNGEAKYLGAGEEWGTHAIVDNVGLDYYLSFNEGKYTIDSRVSNGYDSQYLNGEWNDGPLFGWTFVDKGNGNYMISDGNQFLAAQEDGRVVMTNDTTLSYLWTLKTLEQRLAELANVTPENPVDATFLIQGANFSRNDQRNYAWSLNASNSTLSGGNNVNNCAESYHSAFTLTQTLYNAPTGKYLVSAQGFYRQDGDMTEELPVFYANNSTAAFPVKDGAENSMSDASESFSVGLYNIEPFVVNVSEAGALTIGARGTALSQWVIFDNFRLTYLSSEVDVDDIAADYAQVLADAKATLESEHYVMVTGIERESLAETIEAYSAVENEQYAYMDAINHLSYATSYFTNAKDAYERLIKAKEQLANCVEDYSYANPRYKEEASEYAELTAQMADDASIMADWVISQARRIAESHALLEGVENSANMTGYISNADAYFGRDYWELVLNSGGYIDIRGDQPLTSADYGTYSYFDGGNWSSDYWDVALQQEINLPAGKYQLTVSSRASSDVAFTLFAGDESVAMPTIGSEGGLFGYGWNDTSLEFEMAEEGPVTIGVRGETNVIHNWMSFTRFRLAKFPNAADYNKLYIADDTNLSKGNATLPISLQNEDEIVGLQFDVVLPYDMTLTEIASGFRTDSHSVSFNQMGDGSVRVVMASLNNEVIEGSDGVLLNLGVQVPAYMQMGWYGVTLKNVVMTTASLQTVKSADQTFYVNISGRMGDVNSDDMVDVTDVVMIIDNILQHYNENFNEAMADVNSDGYIDVTDVVNVIDAILGNIELSRGAEMIDRLAYTAFQMDLTIPAGYVLESVSLTDIAKDSHSLAYNMLPDGRCRVVVCSMNNEALPGAWDEVISLNLRGKGDAQVNIDRAVFVTIDGERHELMMNPTSIAQISNLKSQTSNLYDLQGRKIEKVSKGILIENGKKVVIK